MALQYPPQWKFEGIGFAIPNEAYNQLYTLILKIAKGTGDPKDVIEEFKSSFGREGASSSYEWAISDLSSAMFAEISNAAAFIDAYWSTIEILGQRGIAVPSENRINEILHQHDVPLTIKPPYLVLNRTL